jgi:ubiquinol-cytochrome c reductase core subunit 2
MFSAAAAAAKPDVAGARISREVKTSTAPNGVIVASVDSFCPVSRVAIAVKAGSRYEKPSSVGASHMFRIAAGLGSKDCTQISIVRNLNQIGASLTVTGSREYLLYDVSCIRDHMPTAIKYMNETAMKPAFKHWEVSDSIPRLKVELASACYSNEVAALELLHRAAYRNTGLGNSIYAPAHNIGNLTPDRLSQFFEETFTGGRMAVVGVGVDHAALEDLAGAMGVPAGTGVVASGKYGGGEARVETGGALTTFAVAFEGAGWSDPKAAVTAMVLQQSLGTGPYILRGHGAGALQKAVSVGEGPVSVSGLNANYSDSGLVGFVASCDAKDAGKVAKAAFGTLKSTLSDADVARGKAQTLSLLWSMHETGAGFCEGIGEVALLTGKVMTAKDIQKIVESVTAGEVNAMLKKVSSGKASMGAVGNLTQLPYLDEL